MSFIGASFSMHPNAYEQYKETKDGEIFEKLISDIILNKYSNDQNLTEFILSLPKEKQRLAVLSLIDKERKGDVNHLWSEMVSYVRDNVSKMEHIKNVVKIINQFVKDGEVEKKKHGEVMTPITLVREMLDTLPKEVWSNPNLKWLDPANGAGTFPFVIIYKLMNGLSEWEPNEEKRYKHIVESMIYTCELQSRNVFLWLCGVDPKDEYTTNAYWGSFLDEGFDKHMKDVWDVDKFDIVVGNPPYNDEVSVSGTSADIYDKFVMKSDLISNQILMVTPSKWFSKADKKNMRDLLIKKGKLVTIVTNCIYFDELAIRGGVSYFLTNSKNNDMVKFDNEFKNLKVQYEEFGFIFMKQSESDILYSILTKLKDHSTLSEIFNSKSYFKLKTNHKNVQLNGIKCYFSGRQKHSLNLIKDNNNEYYSFVTSVSDVKNKLDKWKLITPAAYGFKTKSENTYNQVGRLFISPPGEACTESFIFFDLNSEVECINMKKYFMTNFFKFLVSLKKSKQDVTSKIFEIIPYLDFTKEWDDDKIFTYFNLTSEEKKLILNI